MSAVRPPTPSESEQTGPAGPIRTCIGCRQRSPATELLRVVVETAATGTVGHEVGHSTPADGASVRVVPDPRRRTAGRGAWLHYDAGCAELAERRRAYGRALRLPVPADSTAVREYLADTVCR